MKKFFYRIKKFTQVVIDVQVRVILTIAYFIIITPVGLFFRLFGGPLEIKKIDVPRWKAHKEIEDIPEFLSKQ